MAAISNSSQTLFPVFQQDVRSHWDKISSAKHGNPGNPGKNYKQGAIKAFEIFEQTFSSPLPFVLIGPDRLREDPHIQKNLGLVTNKKSGAVLGESQWSRLINDAFILGAINGGKDVFLSSKPPSHEERRTLTPLERELALLKITGYKRIKCDSKYGICFQLNRDLPFEEWTLDKLWSKLKIEAPTVESLHTFLNEYDCP